MSKYKILNNRIKKYLIIEVWNRQLSKTNGS